MEMYYDGALVMPKNYAVVDEEEMEYVDAGGTLNIRFKGTLSANMLRAAFVSVEGTAIGTLCSCFSIALGATGIGAAAIPVAVTSIVSVLATVFSNWAIESDVSFDKTISIWAPGGDYNKVVNLGYIGWK